MPGLPRPVFIRLGIALALGICALLLSLRGTPEIPPGAPEPPPDLTRISAEVDRSMDSILVGFHIEKNLWRKRTVEIPGAPFPRSERKILANVRVPAVLLNAALNEMAQGYGGRAIGTENSKEGSISIHIEVAGVILQTVILRK